MVRSCYADRFNPQQLYEVGILIVPIFQMRTNEAPSISRAGPRSHREEIEELGLSASNTCALSTKHPFPSIPTASLQVPISRPQSRSTLSGEGRTPRTQDMTMRWGGPSASSRKCRITWLPWKQVAQSAQTPWPPISCNYSQGLCLSTFSCWQKVLLVAPQKTYPELQPRRPGHKIKKNAQANAGRTIFLKGHGRYPCAPLGLEPHWPLFSHILWSLNV